jgi:hypothetical protein
MVTILLTSLHYYYLPYCNHLMANNLGLPNMIFDLTDFVIIFMKLRITSPLLNMSYLSFLHVNWFSFHIEENNNVLQYQPFTYINKLLKFIRYVHFFNSLLLPCTSFKSYQSYNKQLPPYTQMHS